MSINFCWEEKAIIPVSSYFSQKGELHHTLLISWDVKGTTSSILSISLTSSSQGERGDLIG